MERKGGEYYSLVYPELSVIWIVLAILIGGVVLTINSSYTNRVNKTTVYYYVRRIILFVVLNLKFSLDKNLILKIKKNIKIDASPRHVPSKIIEVNDIPRTKNGKIVELAVKNIIEGNKIKNVQALANPEVLDDYKNIKELQN